MLNNNTVYNQKMKFNIFGSLNKRIICKIAIVFMWLSYPLFITYFSEFIQRQDILKTNQWFLSRPVHVLLGYFIVLLIFTFLWIISQTTWIAAAVTGCIFLISATVNYYKVTMRGDPFVPWDVMLSKEAGNIIRQMKIEFSPKLLFVIGITILFIIGFYFIKDKKLTYKMRGLLLIIIMGIFGSAFKFLFLNTNHLKQIGVYDANWSQLRNYDYNGFLMGFIINIKNVIIDEPKAYSKENMESILNHATNYPSDTIKPNIIMIMNESFWDPTKLKGTQFSEDPIPTINKLRREGISGFILSQQYGGGTANTEFEVLTGDGMMFLPTGSIAYQQYINKKTPSMASFFKSEGYQTVAVHAYEKWFWDRQDVYPLIGFDHFFSNVDFENPDIRGNYISDMDTVKKVISEYENSQAHSADPFFGFAVTMQNHAPYNQKVYNTRTIEASHPKASKEANTILNNYVQGVKDADSALSYLIDYFKRVDKPTVIVMFGDHLPMMGDNYKVYKEAGYLRDGEWTAEDYLNMYTTPFVAWSNYNLYKKDVGIINAHYLGPEILSDFKIDMPNYFNFLLDLKQKAPAFTKYVCLDEKGTAQLKASEAMQKEKEKHWLYEYDTLFGKGYITKKMFEK